MTMYCIAGLSMMHMLLHVESECDIHDITRGRMWRNNNGNDDQPRNVTATIKRKRSATKCNGNDQKGKRSTTKCNGNDQKEKISHEM